MIESTASGRRFERTLTLAMEVSNPSAVEGAASGSVAVGEAGPEGAVTLGVEAVAMGDRHADDLAPAIDRLFRRLGRSPRELARVAVSLGPGGYTSLRMGVATGATIAEAIGAECAGVETDAVVAARVRAAGPFAVVLASKRDLAWVRIYSRPDSPAGEGAIMDATAFAGACSHARVGTVVADRFLPAAFASEAAALDLRLEAPVFDAAACFEVSLARPGIPPIMLAPIYGREPEAARQWRNRAVP